MSEILIRSYALERAKMSDDGDGRTIEMQAAPWDVEAVIAPNTVEVFDRHSFDAQLRAANRVKLTLGHPRRDQKITDSLIGNLAVMESRDAGLWVQARMATSATAGEALALARDGVLDQVSIGFIDLRTEEEVRDDGVKVLRRMAARLDHVALVPSGNFGDHAKILAVRETQPGPGLADLRALAQRLG